MKYTELTLSLQKLYTGTVIPRCSRGIRSQEPREGLKPRIFHLRKPLKIYREKF